MAHELAHVVCAGNKPKKVGRYLETWLRECGNANANRHEISVLKIQLEALWRLAGWYPLKTAVKSSWSNLNGKGWTRSKLGRLLHDHRPNQRKVKALMRVILDFADQKVTSS